MKESKTQKGANLRNFRFSKGHSQVEFWSRLGLTQPAGSRYERGDQPPPKLVAILLDLWARGVITTAKIDAVQGGVNQALEGKGYAPKALREQWDETQTVFWRRLGLTQPAGSRYEKGDVLTRPVALLLVLLTDDHVSRRQLELAFKHVSSGQAKP